MAIYFLVIVLTISVVLSPKPIKSLAADDPIPLTSISFDIVEILKDTGEELSYITVEDGRNYLYEEKIAGDIVNTKKSLIKSDSFELLEHFSTTTILNEKTLSVTQKDLISNVIISESSIDILTADEIKLQNQPYQDDELTIYTTGKWVNTRAVGLNYSYYKYNNGGGKARELNLEKAVKSYDKKFDTFTRSVDALRSHEIGTLKSLVGIGLLDQFFKSVKNPSLANVKDFFKKYLKSIPAIGVLVAVIDYFRLINKTIPAYEAVPGIEKKWR